MNTSLGKRLRMALAVAGALALGAPVWSDVRVGSGASNGERMCYCECDAQAGSAMCTHMCDLPKYENRSWANSCHRPTEYEPEQRSVAPGANSSKDNGVQQARR